MTVCDAEPHSRIIYYATRNSLIFLGSAHPCEQPLVLLSFFHAYMHTTHTRFLLALSSWENDLARGACLLSRRIDVRAGSRRRATGRRASRRRGGGSRGAAEGVLEQAVEAGDHRARLVHDACCNQGIVKHLP